MIQNTQPFGFLFQNNVLRRHGLGLTACGVLVLLITAPVNAQGVSSEEDIPTLSVKMGVKKEVIKHVEKKQCHTWVYPDRGFVVQCDEKVHLVEVPEQEKEEGELSAIEFEPEKQFSIELPSTMPNVLAELPTAAPSVLAEFPQALFNGMMDVIQESLQAKQQPQQETAQEKAGQAEGIPLSAILLDFGSGKETGEEVAVAKQSQFLGEKVGEMIMSKVTELRTPPKTRLRPATNDELEQLVDRLEKEVAYFESLYGSGKHVADKSYPYYLAGELTVPDEGVVMQALSMHEGLRESDKEAPSSTVLPTRSVLETAPSAAATAVQANGPHLVPAAEDKPSQGSGLKLNRLFGLFKRKAK